MGGLDPQTDEGIQIDASCADGLPFLRRTARLMLWI